MDERGGVLLAQQQPYTAITRGLVPQGAREMSEHSATRKPIAGPLSRTGRAIWVDTVLLAECNKWDESNSERNAQGRAAYIVRACNALPALVSAVRSAENWLSEFGADSPDTGLQGLVAELRAALAQAGER